MAAEHGPPQEKHDETLVAARADSKKYRDSCGSGYKGGLWQAHHVIPCASLRVSITTFLSKKPPEYERALMYFTTWNVNESYNLLGLPTFRDYQIAFNAMAKRQITTGNAVWFVKENRVWKALASSHAGTPKYPIHSPSTWGHLDYSDRVELQLDDIWTELAISSKEHEPVEANDMASAIQAISDSFRGQLVGKTGQTAELWNGMTGGVQHAQFKMA